MAVRADGRRVVVLAAGSSVRSAERTSEHDPRHREQEDGRRAATARPARRAVYQPETVHTSWFSRAASAAAAARQSSPRPPGRRTSPSARRLTSALAGPLVNARAMSAGVAPCAPTPGQEQDRLRQQPAAPRRRRGGGSRRRRRRRTRDRTRRRAPRRARARARRPGARAGGRRRASDPGRRTQPAFEVLTRQKIPPPPRRQAATNGSSESRPRYGLTVSASASRLTPLARLEIGVGVRARGRADVAALAVDDHEQPGRAGVADDALEGGDAVGAEHLEERELRLDGDCVRRDRVDDPAAEPRSRLGRGRPADVRVAAQLEREQVEPRVEPDDQLAVLARRRPRRDGRRRSSSRRRRSPST